MQLRISKEGRMARSFGLHFVTCEYNTPAGEVMELTDDMVLYFVAPIDECDDPVKRSDAEHALMYCALSREYLENVSEACEALGFTLQTCIVMNLQGTGLHYGMKSLSDETKS
jgi:hypothetical protein